MMNKIKTYFLLLFIMLGSCKSPVQKVIDGMWLTQEINYKGYDLLSYLNGNMIEFAGEKVILSNMDSFSDEMMLLKRDGKFSFNKTQDSITFNVDNNVFRGKHRIYFTEDKERKVIKLIIESEDLFVSSTKFLFDYNAER